MTPARPRTGRLSVGIVTPGWSAPDGEPALPALSDLVDRLAVDHDVRVVALRYPPVVGAYARGGIAVYPLAGGARAGPLGRGFLLGRAVETLRRMHATRPFDLLHAFWADEAGAAAVVAGRLLRLPVIVSVLGGELQALDDIGYGSALGRGGRWTVRLTLRGADWSRLGRRHWPRRSRSRHRGPGSSCTRWASTWLSLPQATNPSHQARMSVSSSWARWSRSRIR